MAISQKSLAVTNGAKRIRAAPTAALSPGFRSSLLGEFTPSEIKAVLAAARQRQIFPHQVIQHEGDPATHLFLLVTGRAARYKLTHEGRKLFLHWITPGDAFGLMTLLSKPPPCLTTVQGVQEGSVFVWDRVSIRALVALYPQLCENLYSVVTNYLASLIDVLVARTSQTAQQRLARMLIESARQIGHAGRKGIEFDLTNEQLAEMAGVSIFTASRQLSQWQRQGILTKSRGTILLRSPEHLVSQHF
jgi:CRP/FNR family transcriptional regulator, nitrogen oxide reductase regulator